MFVCEFFSFKNYPRMDREDRLSRIPWKDDWQCPTCQQCNYGKDNYCTYCGTRNPNKKEKRSRKYCKRCGRLKE